MLIIRKEDALNGIFAKRMALSDTDFDNTIFYSDHSLMKTAAEKSKWQYNKILTLAVTRAHLIWRLG